MRVLRSVVGVVILIYALAGAALGVTMASLHLGVEETPPAWASPAQADFLQHTSWPLIILWLVAMALHFVVALKLLRRVKTFLFWAGAFAAGFASWVWMRAGGYYEPAIPPSFLYADYLALTVSLAFGICIWVLGRTHLD